MFTIATTTIINAVHKLKKDNNPTNQHNELDLTDLNENKTQAQREFSELESEIHEEKDLNKIQNV